MYHEDNVVYSIPQLTAVARYVQKGQFPLWDSQTFAGGLPHYSNDELPTYYPVMLPFFLAVDTEDVAQCGFVLFVLPFCLHILWAAAGAFFFARWVLRLHPAACVVVAVIYAFGPDMASSTFLAPIAYTFSYLPWMMLAASKLVDSPSIKWWIIGIGLTSLMMSTGEINFASRICFITFAAAAAHACFARIGRRAILSMAAVASMFLLAGGLTAVMWLGVLDGIRWFNQGLGVQLVTEQGRVAVPPAALVTMFVPHFLGTLDGSHGWGVGVGGNMCSWSFLTGGMFTLFAASAAVAVRVLRWKQKKDPTAAWTWVAASLLLLTIIIIMGTHTPLFKPLSFVMPWLKIPREVYYRFGETWFVAVLAGIGLSHLLMRPSAREWRATKWIAAACVTVAGALAATAMLLPVAGPAGTGAAYKMLSHFQQWDWFLFGPVLYLAVASIALVVLTVAMRSKALGWLLAAGVLAEAAVFGFIFLNEPVFSPRAREETDAYAAVYKRRYRRLADHPYYQAVPALRELTAGKNVRVVGTYSDIDNLAWAAGGYALLGFDSKPLMPRMHRISSVFTQGEPYVMTLSVPPQQCLALWSNMNAAYLVAYNSQGLRSSGDLIKTDFLSILKLPEPIPYVYTQNRVQELEERDQFQAICRSDLRRFVAVEPGQAAVLKGKVDLTRVPWGGYIEAFDALQSANRITALDRSNANRLSLNIDVTVPAMLVINECHHSGWSARVNGRTAPLLQVNYLQQGLWLTSGQSHVELEFFPAAVKRGLMVSVASGLVVILSAGVAMGLRRRRRRVTHG
ncbi:MAG: hypothetical protein ABFD92_01505 [Planctomycetaceae bacterium]|nr:hypothetical protein [Planctomycetaceae bacterium]